MSAIEQIRSEAKGKRSLWCGTGQKEGRGLVWEQTDNWPAQMPSERISLPTKLSTASDCLYQKLFLWHLSQWVSGVLPLKAWNRVCGLLPDTCSYSGVSIQWLTGWQFVTLFALILITTYTDHQTPLTFDPGQYWSS